jgi:hypothetical protein
MNNTDNDSSFKTDLLQGDFIGNAIGMQGSFLEFDPDHTISIEALRPSQYYDTKKLSGMRDRGGIELSADFRECLEPETIAYMNHLVDALAVIVKKDITAEQKMAAIGNLVAEAKQMNSLEKVKEWKVVFDKERSAELDKERTGEKDTRAA